MVSCNSSLFCYALLYVLSSFAIILMGKRELMALLSLSSLCLVIVVWLLLSVSLVCQQVVIVVFSGHIHLLFLNTCMLRIRSFALVWNQSTRQAILVKRKNYKLFKMTLKHKIDFALECHLQYYVINSWCNEQLLYKEHAIIRIYY